MRDDQEDCAACMPPALSPPPARLLPFLLEGFQFHVRISRPHPLFLVIRSLPTVVSFCARHDVPPQKNPTVGSGSSARMVIASFFPRSLGHTHTIKGNPPFFCSSYERRRGVPKEGDRNRPASPCLSHRSGKGAPRFCRVLSAAIPQNSLKFGAYPSGIKQKKNKWKLPIVIS
jgi:hypothetical protein